MRDFEKNSKRKQRGGALIGALVFTVVISMLLAGIGTLSVSHYARANAECDYANALYVAEAGINYGSSKITNNVALADAVGTGSGMTCTLGAGSCSV